MLKYIFNKQNVKNFINYSTVRFYSYKKLKFEEAVQKVENLKKSLNDEEKLDLDFLYKRSIENNTKSETSPLDLKNIYKDAWTKYNKLSKEEAQIKYAKKIEEFIEKYEIHNSNSNINQDLIITLENSIKTIKFNRPKKCNSFTIEMYKQVTNEINEASKDDKISALILTGTGDYYSSGNDLNIFSSISDLKKIADVRIEILIKFVDSFINFEKPLIAIVNGHAIGILVTTLGLCDYIVATNQSTFLTPFSSTAQVAEGCSTYTFPRIFGTQITNKMLLFNYKLTSQEALNYGFISEVVDKNDLEAYVEKLKKNLINNCSKNSLIWGKKLIRTEQIKDELRKVNRIECENLKKAWLNPEFAKFLSSFLQRKK